MGAQSPSSILGPHLKTLQSYLPEGNTIRLGISVLVPGAILLIIETDVYTEETAARAAELIRQQAREILKEHGLLRLVRTTLKA